MPIFNNDFDLLCVLVLLDYKYKTMKKRAKLHYKFWRIEICVFLFQLSPKSVPLYVTCQVALLKWFLSSWFLMGHSLNILVHLLEFKLIDRLPLLIANQKWPNCCNVTSLTFSWSSKSQISILIITHICSITKNYLFY